MATRYVITAPDYSIKSQDVPSYWWVSNSSHDGWSKTMSIEISGFLRKSDVFNRNACFEVKGKIVDVSDQIIEGDFNLQMTIIAMMIFTELSNSTYEIISDVIEEQATPTEGGEGV